MKLIKSFFLQVLVVKDKAILRKIKKHLRSHWNKFDLIVTILLIASIILRCVLLGDNFYWARIVYNITLLFYYLRSLQLFYVQPDTGPKLIMVKKMVRSSLPWVKFDIYQYDDLASIQYFLES